MKICFICPEYPEGPHGGIGSLVQIISRELVNLGHEVRVIGIYPKSYPAPDYEIDKGVQIWRLRNKQGKFGWVIPYIQQYKIIRKWSQNRQIEIVEAPDSRGWFAFWPNLSIPLVLRANGSNIYFSKILNSKPRRITFLMEKKSYKRADGIIAASKFTADVLSQFIDSEKKVEIIYNGINVPKLSEDLVRYKNRVLFTASLNRKKGIFQFIETVKILFSKQLEIVVDIYGKDTIDQEFGSVRSYLQNVVCAGFEDKINFKEQITRQELAVVYQTGTVAVFPSFAEAFAMAPLEAMACGCPVINTKLGSGSEFIENEIDGMLVDPSNPQEISDAIEKIINDEEFARMIGRNAKEKVKRKFLADNMVINSLSFYSRISDNFKFNNNDIRKCK
jgi:glycosyltransferase involved in cell wall biosynthesis